MCPVGVAAPDHRVCVSASSSSVIPDTSTASSSHSRRCLWVPPVLVLDAFKSPANMFIERCCAVKLWSLHLIMCWMCASGDPFILFRPIQDCARAHSVSNSGSAFCMGQYVLISCML